ncbi:ATP-binding protein [Actinoplanes sp. DH11]|uniref:sensor histidine kinase n=1 Tax=Actinoplanes sp. DH11 TaxID=2857011 RepID=UPI001E495F09|nr:ATP-binding protein [Actinoplanes sp. DH11]
MSMVDEAVIGDTARVAAADRARRVLPAQPMPLDAIARLAARLVHAPMAALTLVGGTEEFFVGVHDMPGQLTSSGRAPLAYSVCKYIVSQDHPVHCGDMRRDFGGRLSDHPLAAEFGIRAFLGVPVRDAQDRAVGSLTVLDTAPRQWSDHDITVLVEAAELLRPAGTEPAGPTVAALDSATLLDGLQEAFLAVTPDGLVVGFNRAAQKMLGYPPGEVCGRHLQDTLLPDYGGQPIGAALDRLFTAGPRQPVPRQISARHRDGHRLPVRASLSVARGAAGALACIFLTDMSEQTTIQERADRNDGFLTALLDSLSVGVVACDETGQVVVLNRVLREVQGRPASGAPPADYPSAIDGLLRDTEMQPIPWQQTPLMRALRGEHIASVDVLTTMPGDRIRTFASTAQPIRAADGRLLGAVAVAHEVTAMRRAERFRTCHRTVQHALRNASSTAEATPGVLQAVGTALGWPCAELFLIDETTGHLRSVGHWDIDDAEPDGFFGHTPQRGYGVTGRVWQTGQAIWVPDIAASPQLHTAQEKSRVQVCLARGVRAALAVPVRDGTTLLGVLTCYAATPEVHEDLLTVLLDGVAAQIGVYVALRRAQQLAHQLARTQDDFIALVGHEVRTPLTSIAANATMLGEDAIRFDSDHQQMIHTITRNTATLQTTIDTLLDLAGLESGHVNLHIGHIDLAAIVADAVTAASPTAADAHVRLHTYLPPRLPLDGDPTRLRQVIDNLLTNAVKYSPGGDVHIRLHQADGMARLCVADTGIGTPEQERQRVFDRFYRASNVRHHGTPGSGLGLSLARTIVTLHGGTIDLAANNPSGTSTCIHLPLSEHTPPSDTSG